MTKRIEELIEALEEFAIQGATSNIESAGFVSPVLLVADMKSLGVCPVKIEGEADKDLLSQSIIPAIIEKHRPLALALVTEAWLKDPTDVSKRIGECVTILIKWEQGEKSVSIKINRNNNGEPTLGEKTTSDLCSSRFFCNAWPGTQNANVLH